MKDCPGKGEMNLDMLVYEWQKKTLFTTPRYLTSFKCLDEPFHQFYVLFPWNDQAGYLKKGCADALHFQKVFEILDVIETHQW